MKAYSHEGMFAFKLGSIIEPRSTIDDNVMTNKKNIMQKHSTPTIIETDILDHHSPHS